MTVFKSEIMNLNIKEAVGYLTFKKLEEYSFLKHAFSTRLGGVSEGYFRYMNLIYKDEDKKENVQENRKIFCKAAGIDINTLVKPGLTHSKNVGVAKAENIGSGINDVPPDFKETDGLITNEPRVTLVTSHADCTSIFVLDPNKKAIGLAHAGWRGTVNGIAKEVISKMANEFKCLPSDLICAIGPSICANCYVVKEDVVKEFQKVNFLDINKVILKLNGEFHIDLYEANKQVLLESGVKEENIVISDICTMCNSDLLFSHRATKGKRGGMLAMMSLN